MSIIPFPQQQPPPGDADETGSSSPQDGGHRDEAALVQRLVRSDPTALDLLIERFWEPLVVYASRILDDVALAEDVAQEAFVRMWAEREERAPRSVSAYLYRVTRNLALDELRSRDARHRREKKKAVEMDRRPHTPAETYAEDELSRLMDEAIQSLPERRREAFTLAYLANLSYREVAQTMGISPKTVGNHISAALADLRETLSPLLEADGLP